MDNSILCDRAHGDAAKSDPALTAAQMMFQHKTRKQPLASPLNLALAWNIVAFIG
ncbi:hypothetical protein [Primorskyibacter marinus]|uniref:hypothetical protein n=1 Tax=Primorskyibacter marinus TaxID=1977320 RepID=UPI001300A571|nr:hypothetical protein [Primorskyibacter marinus]